MPVLDADTTFTTVVTTTVSPFTRTFPPFASAVSSFICGLDDNGNEGSPWTSFDLRAPQFSLPKPPCGSTSTAAPMSTLTTTATPLPQSTTEHSGTPASGLSTGSAVGIAFAVFAVGAVVVAAALFLFLRKHRRRRIRDRSSKIWSCTKRHLAPSTGISSRPLSSTWSWSWFGSLPVASPEPEQKYSTHTPWSTPTVRSQAVHGERDPQPGCEDHAADPPPPPAKTEYTTPISPSDSILIAPRGVYGSDRPRDLRDVGRTGVHNPFADPRVYRISSNSTASSVGEGASMEKV